ncbi:MAG: cytochrome c biogenesis protein CcsA [Chloroflexi bacterium]|uniref:Heme exporter protein C n=1 Tax=Candidatus Chlorohelix allophototropha TaxID=3003348 RepID=A0A8T7M9B7_9CHLR|nr:cytochrome c biogenesis protein CcsA [Chloroflexota bacterium]WJW68473.1 cytochrome c biogenesis protein CcsA [Chloroflexota bacterium L227-S17]
MATAIKYTKPTKGLGLSNVLFWATVFSWPISLIFVLMAGDDVNLKYSQRIFYYHLPANIMCFLSFMVYFIGGIAYWRTRNRKWDIVMVAGLELGIFWAVIGIITGAIWARYAWGTFWTWDPRLTTVSIMMVVYISGVMLRSAVEDPTRKAALTAAFGIIGFVNVPLVYFSTRWFPKGEHPVIFGGDSGTPVGLEGFMFITLGVCFVAVGLLFAWMLQARIRLGHMHEELQARRMTLEGMENE